MGDQLSIAWSAVSSAAGTAGTSARYEVFETLTPDGLISELVIRDTDRSDGALYTCHTQNKYGKDDRKVKLIVQDALTGSRATTNIIGPLSVPREVPGPPQDVRPKGRLEPVGQRVLVAIVQWQQSDLSTLSSTGETTVRAINDDTGSVTKSPHSLLTVTLQIDSFRA
ncbi:hypothetical protein MRX96_050864 [Rhipicephalus microplus]